MCYSKRSQDSGPIGSITCATCPHTPCPQNKDHFIVDECPKCDIGMLLLDPASGPKWKMCCNTPRYRMYLILYIHDRSVHIHMCVVYRCSTIVSFFEGAHSVERTGTMCEECESYLLKVNFNKVQKH